MEDFRLWEIISGMLFVVLIVYCWIMVRQFKRDQQENYVIGNNEEREQWKELWNQVEEFPPEQRRRIRYSILQFVHEMKPFIGDGQVKDAKIK